MWPFDRSTDESPESDADTDDEPIDLTPDEPEPDESVTVADAYDETVPENPSVNANHRTGAKIGNAISGALGTFLGTSH